MPRYSLPTIKSKIAEDLRGFLDRVREALDDIADRQTDKTLMELTPSVPVAFFHIASCAATTDYPVGSVLPVPTDRRVRVMITCGATAATFQLTHAGNTYSFVMAVRESVDIIVVGLKGIKEPYLVQSNTGSLDFAVSLFVPSTTQAR